MTKFLTNIDLAQNQLKNAVIHNLSAAPQNPVNGQIYYNTTDNKFYLFSNDSWEAFSTLSEISEKYYNKEQIDEIIETSATLPNQENNSGKALVTDGNDAKWENIIELNNVTLATREGLPKLVINKLTQAEYDVLEAAGLINENELYLTENDPSDNPGASLPDQTNNAGKALVTDGTDVSWQHIVNMNNITESTNGGLSSFNINKLTQAEYDALLENGQINENELYVITDPKEILSKEEISEQITEEVSEQLSELTIPTKTSELTNDSGFITEIPADYITESELDAKGYLTEHQNLDHKADLSYVDNMLADKANVVSTYTKDEVNELLENIDVSGATLPDQTNMSGKVLVSDGENASWTNIIQLNNITESTILPLSNLVINQLTQEEYDNLLANGLIKDDELYITDGNNGGGATGDVPTKLSELTNDTGFITSNDLPTKTSELTNDSGFITEVPSEYITETELDAKGYLTEHQDISGKADKETTYTKEEVDTLIDNIDVSGATLPNQENNSGKALVTNGSEASWENIIELNNVTQSTVEGLPKLVINRLTQEEYNELLANGLVKEDEIYITNGSGGSGSGESLPDQTNNGGKVLTTDGSDASWQHIISMNNTAEGTSAGLATLVINKVTQAEYDALLANDQINDNELYTITDGDGTYASKEYVDEQISNINVPTKTSELTNDSGFITEHQDISGKADKETTYTKEEVNNLIENINGASSPLTKIMPIEPSDWTSNDNGVFVRFPVENMLSTDIVWVSPAASIDGVNEDNYVNAGIRAVTQEDEYLTCYTKLIPSSSIEMQIVYQHV